MADTAPPQTNRHPSTNGTNGTSQDPAPAPLRILIAGAGIGGLFAALALRHEGHHITIFERSSLAREVGAAIHLAPNSNGLLRRLGLFAENFGANTLDWLTEYDSACNVRMKLPAKKMNVIWQHPWHLAHRVQVHEELKRACVSEEGKGRPVELRTGCQVKDVDVAAGRLVLESGEVVKGDVIVGADGVHSATRKQISTEIRPFASEQSAFRFLMPKGRALEVPGIAQYLKEDGELIMWHGVKRRVVMYPTSNNTQLNFVCMHPAEESGASVQNADWDQGASLDTLLKVYEGFDPAVIGLLGQADPKSIKVWSLLDMDELPVWNKDRLVLIGDAAHPFLPHQGQGAGVAMEDGAALACVLPLGTPREEIPERLALYDKIRHERASRIQEVSRILGSDRKEDGFDMRHFTNYNFGHDEFDNAAQRFREYQWAKNPQIYWRMPLPFGPMPGPRQDHLGQPRNGENSTFKTTSIKFKTSRTALQNLFPPGRSGYSFQSPGTLAYASFSQTTLDGMEWLGGKGYNHLGLYIHGTQYTKPYGKVVSGTYMPILFENLADPIVSGREELGMPKLYSTIDVERADDSVKITTGWQGTRWGTFTLSGLSSVSTPDANASGSVSGEADAGIIVHRYMPSVGRDSKGKAEANYTCFVPFEEDSPKPRPESVRTAASAEFKLEAGNWKSLPTLHHVISRLAELPVYEVVGAKVVEGRGVPDVSNAKPV